MGTSNKQSGFGVIEALLVVVAVGIVGFTGWYVYHSQQVADKTLTQTNTSVPTFKRKTTVTKTSTEKKTVTSSTVAACTSDDITAAQGQTTGAAGTFGVGFTFTNKSSAPCTLEGYPTTTLLTSAGQQIGQPAQPNSTEQAPTVTLQPQAVGYLTVLFPDPGMFSGNQCSAGEPSYIDIVPTGQTTGFKVSFTSEPYCPGFSVMDFSSTPNS